MSLLFVLVHSPLVGPSTWSLVADQLRAQQIDAVVPNLFDSELDQRPYWQQHAGSVAHVLGAFPHDRTLILVGHSGAGPLLPAIRQLLPQTVAGYIFVDAGLPLAGASRLDLLTSESSTFATDLRQHLEAGERFPTWADAELRSVIPNRHHHHQLLAELRPRALPFFAEPIPVFGGWPDAPCAYIQFSAAYDAYAIQARQAKWSVYTIEADHFHMLVAPVVVANLLEAVAHSITE